MLPGQQCSKITSVHDHAGVQKQPLTNPEVVLKRQNGGVGHSGGSGGPAPFLKSK